MHSLFEINHAMRQAGSSSDVYVCPGSVMPSSSTSVALEEISY